IAEGSWSAPRTRPCLTSRGSAPEGRENVAHGVSRGTRHGFVPVTKPRRGDRDATTHRVLPPLRGLIGLLVSPPVPRLTPGATPPPPLGGQAPFGPTLRASLPLPPPPLSRGGRRTRSALPTAACWQSPPRRAS